MQGRVDDDDTGFGDDATQHLTNYEKCFGV